MTGGGGSSKLPLIIGGVVAAIVVIVAAVVLLGGGDDGDSAESESDEVISAIALGIRSTSELSVEDSECVARVVVDAIGLEVLIDAGLSAGRDGDLSQLDPDVQDKLFDAIFDSFERCNLSAADFGN